MKNHIAIVGAGNGGQAFAGYLSLMGERIKIFDVIPATVEKLNEVGGVLMEGNSKLTGFGKIEKATTSMQEVIEGAKLIFIAFFVSCRYGTPDGTLSEGWSGDYLEPSCFDGARRIPESFG